MDCRFGSLDFDIAASAGWYSAIAGVLAGFALLAILLPLDHESAEDAAHEGLGPADSVVIFTCAFFSLLILGFSYAVLAGRTGEGRSSASPCTSSSSTARRSAWPRCCCSSGSEPC